VFLNHSANYAVEHLHLDLKNVVAGVPNRDFYSPGSLLNVTLDTHNPNSPMACRRTSRSGARTVRRGRFREQQRSCGRALSGRSRAGLGMAARRVLSQGARGAGRSAMGQGRAVLFGMRPQYRAQSYQAFKLFFNSLVLSSAR
jgi:hypothetical protein